jgi:hypothetical protein
VIRWLLGLVIVVAVAYAQDSTSSARLVANNAAHEATSADVASPVARPAKGSALTLQEVPPLPAGKATLLGGTIQTVDHVRDRLVLKVFGGSRTAVLFDERTRVFRDGKNASLDDLRNGERAYVDTTLDGTDIFARNIRIAAQAATGQSSGQIVDFQPGKGELLVRDTISPEPVKMRLASNAVILQQGRVAPPSELQPGTLVNVTFLPGNGEVPNVQQISILATPGTAFVFSGRIEHLDLHRGLLVLVDPRDNKSYEVHFDPAARGLTRNLKQGDDVTVQANFDGTRYQSRDIAVNSVSAQ